MSRYRFIAEEKAHHSVVLLWRVLGVAKSAFYAWQHQRASARAQADQLLTKEIHDIYDDSRCTYSARECMPSCESAASVLLANASPA